MGGIRLFVWVVGLGTLLAGVVGVSNIMLIAVQERTREIGIRKALGATPRSIVALVLQESILITAVAGYVGLVLGLAVLEVASRSLPKNGFFQDPEVDLAVALQATLLLIVGGARRRVLPGPPGGGRPAGRGAEERMSLVDLDHWQEIYEAPARQQAAHVPDRVRRLLGHLPADGDARLGDRPANGVLQGFGDGATNSFFVWAQRTSKPWRGMASGRFVQLDNGDVEAIRREVPEAEVVCPRNQLGGFRGGNNVTRGTKAGAFSVMGDVPEIAKVQSIRLVEGRFLNPLDSRSAARSR